MKKSLAYILIIIHIIFIWNLGVVYAAIGDIGHWRDSVGGQIPATSFGGFDFDSEVRNDGIYTKPNNSTIEVTEAGDYLIIATTHDEDTSNGRYNSQLTVSQIAGTGDVFSSYYTGYSRDNSENQSWTRAVGVVIGASANSEFQIQKRRDTDAPTGGSVVNSSDVQVIRINPTNYGIYAVGGSGNSYGGVTPNTVDITSVVSESSTAAIEGNTGTETITLKGDNKKYLVAWSVSFETGGARTQRVGHLEYDGSDKLSTRSYCYQRSTANEYCGLGSMDIIQTGTADINLQTEVYRGDGVAANQGGADDDGNAVTDGNGQMIILEMPDSLEIFSSEDSVGLQDVTAAQTLNIARDVIVSDALSFTKNSDSEISVTNPADIFSWTNVWTARGDISAGQRQTSYGSIVIDGVEQNTGRHGNYSRGNQGTQDTFAMSFHPAGIFTTSGAGATLGVNTDPLPGGEAGGNDSTQPGTLGFFAINLDTLLAPNLDQQSYRFFNNTNSTDVGIPYGAQNSPAILSADGEAFRLRSLINISINQLRQDEKNLKLQFAEKVGSCDTSFTGESYVDVTAATSIAFNNNTTPSDGDTLTTNANDPTDGNTIVSQSYEEGNNFSNSLNTIPNGQDGMWDFSLIDNSAPDNTSYCFRIVESDGTPLDTYTHIPEITTYSPIISSGPGGVSTNLQVWLRSNAGTSTTIDGNTLASWADQSGNGYDANAVNAPIYRNNATDALNFHPVVDFNGTNQYMQNLGNGAYTDSYFMVIIPDNTVDGTLTGQVPFGFDCNSGVLSSGTCGLTFAGTVLGAFTVAIPDEVITHAIGSSANWRSAQNGSASYNSAKPMLIAMNENAGASNTDIYEKGVKVDSIITNTYQSLSTADYTIGRSPDATYPFYYDGKVAEIINYSGRVSDAERNRIESYLSLKYGITLNSGTQNYIAADGSTTFWSTSTAGIFTYNIFGIGRDDITSLSQIQSKSVNDDAIITLEAVGEGTNQSPSFVDMGNTEFLTFSHNGGSNTWSLVDAPATYNILTRKWKAQEVGEVGTVNLDFDVADSDFDIPVLNAGTNYYFVYDSDDDGNLSDETPLSMTNTSGDIWQIAGININHSQIFTIATQAGANNIPTDITLSNDVINENVADNSTIGTLSTIDADLGDSHTYSLVAGIGDDNNSLFTIVGSNLNINYSPDYELKDTYSVRIETDDGSGGTYQESFTISINNLGEAISSIIDFEDVSDEEKYTVTSGDWSRTTTTPQEGTYSLESDNGGVNNTQSCFEIQHNMTAPGNIEFQYNVSSQNGSDFLHFYIDNIEQQTWSGTVPWTLYSSASIPLGVHDYKWCYIKDAGGSAGTDNAFIDYINFPNVTEPNLIVTLSDNDADNSVQTSQVVQYTIGIENTGANATGVSAVSSIDTDFGAPYGFNYVNCGSPGQSFSNPTLTFSNIDILAGNTCSITYYTQVDAGATNGASIPSSVDVSDAVEGGNNPANVNGDTLSVVACGVNDVTLFFDTDNYGEDTYWSLVSTGNACGVGEVANGGNTVTLSCSDGGTPATAGTGDPYADNTTITEGPYSLTVGSQYDIHMIDDYGDGGTTARVNQNGGDTDTFNVAGDGGIFTFTVQQPPACVDTINPEVTVNQAASQADPTAIDSATFTVIFNEAINAGTFTSGDISLSGTTGTVASGPTETTPFNGTSFEFVVSGMTDGDTVTATISAGIVEDTSGNTNNASTSIDNQITYEVPAGDTTPPTISSINYASGSLLPGGNHNIIINYSDSESGIDTSSDNIALYKWNGTTWGSNISATGLNLGTKTITSTQATYPTNNLSFGKYRYDFDISDNDGNTSSTGAIFYIDEPEFIISTGSIDIGNINNFLENFSDEVVVTVKTVGAAFDVNFNRTSSFTEGIENIPSWDSIKGYGYDPAPYTNTISPINTNQNIASQTVNINTDGNKNTYTYNIKIGALVEEGQTAGDYIGDLEFTIELDY